MALGTQLIGAAKSRLQTQSLLKFIVSAGPSLPAFGEEHRTGITGCLDPWWLNIAPCKMVVQWDVRHRKPGQQQNLST